MPLTEKRLLKVIKSGSLFDYVQCDIEVPKNLRETSANFPPILKKIKVGRDDIGPFMKKYAEKKKTFGSAYKNAYNKQLLDEWNNNYATAALLCGHGAGLQKTYHFVQYAPIKCFNNFVESAVNARREGDENPNSNVVAETLKLLANKCLVSQIINRSRHTVTKYLSHEKTHGAIGNKIFKSLSYTNDQLYEVELVKSESEHKETIIVGFLILQYAK